MIDTATRQAIADAVDKAKSKTADTVDTARGHAERAQDAATSVMSKAFAEGKERAQAGASALAKAAQERAEDYSDTWANADPVGEARALAASAASRASEAFSDLGKILADTTALAGDRLGDAYDDVARGAARSIKETAARLDSGDLEELGKAVKKFVRQNPALTLGVAAVAGYLAYRSLKKKTPDIELADEPDETA